MSSKKEKRNSKKFQKMQALVNLTEPNEINDDEPSTKRIKIDSDNINNIIAMRKVVRERNRKTHPPKLGLKPLGESAHLDNDPAKRIPIFLTDIPNFLLRLVLGEEAPEHDWPWYKIERAKHVSHTVVLVIEGLSLFHFQSYPACFENTLIHFDIKLETVLPPYKGNGEIIEEIISVPLTLAEKENLIKDYESLENAKKFTRQSPIYITKSIFPINSDVISDLALPKNDNFSRIELLLSPMQLIHEEYPFPMNGQLHHRYKNYVFTKNVYSDVTPSSPMFGLDCEMVRTDKNILELARISIVDEDHKSIYESLVLPKNVIVDYLTEHSGITPELLKSVTKTLKDVQNDIQNLLPSDAILVGHSLQNDLIVMKMMHPYVIDTSVIYNVTGHAKYKSKLKHLTKQFLNEDIQNSKMHDSVEDAISSLKLVQLKLRNSINFADEVIKSRRRSHLIYNKLLSSSSTSTTDNNLEEKNESDEQQPKESEICNNLIQTTKLNKLTSAIVVSEKTNLDYTKYLQETHQDQIKFVKATNNKNTIKQTIKSCHENDFTLGHIRMPSEDFNDDNIEENLKRVDNMIAKLWQSIDPNGILTVILGGSEGASTGVLLVALKKQIQNPPKRI